MSTGALLPSLTAGHSALMAQWKKKDLGGAAKSLDAMKLMLTEAAFLPTEGKANDCQKVRE